MCVLFAFPFIFSQCVKCESSDQWAKLIYYAAFVTIFQFGWASVQISHLSLIPDLTPTDHERTELTALRYKYLMKIMFLLKVIWECCSMLPVKFFLDIIYYVIWNKCSSVRFYLSDDMPNLTDQSLMCRLQVQLYCIFEYPCLLSSVAYSTYHWRNCRSFRASRCAKVPKSCLHWARRWLNNIFDISYFCTRKIGDRFSWYVFFFFNFIV